MWSSDLPTLEVGDAVASMVADEDHLYILGTRETVALSLEALAVGKNPVQWTAPRGGANCASPIILGKKLFFISDTGIAVCLDVQTGKVLGQKRLSGEYRASPIGGGGFVYFTNTSGSTAVVRADGSLETLSVNYLEDDVVASPVAASGRLYIRSISTLYCIGPGSL